MIFNNPFSLFDLWYDQAQKQYNKHSLIGNAVTLSTANKEGKPSSRILLLQNYNPEGFIFYTNKNSKKGQEITQNPQVSFLFYWQLLSRQIRIEGALQEVPDEVSDAYFESRPYLSKVGAWASQQSSQIKNPGDFQKAVEHYKNQYPKEVPRPPHWGGYKLTPVYFEFWKNAQFRLHTRRIYELKKGGWVKSFIYP